jgi:hypothetical protein
MTKEQQMALFEKSLLIAKTELKNPFEKNSKGNYLKRSTVLRFEGFLVGLNQR